ncbi:hypothetical protein IC229_06780 [Spirosoma sp. BT702]|uniref:Lipoprotein n=1 Tax=Spirosoma profusum TaxID=2771354 RepID=A0A927AQG0_9BACT|nr:hypothetical protein [Spirosoma profusum]MBD2700331.1 hypothetical protein [Spirosoma profusum]
MNIQKLIASTFLLVSVAVSSCRREETPSANCPNAGAYVKRVRDARGEVFYDSSQVSWFIRVPNSFDSHDIGFACNLANNFQQAGLKVAFSGSYYEYDKAVFGIAGNKYFYLSLESVTVR